MTGFIEKTEEDNMAHYTITPLEKKSIEMHYELFRNNEDGSISTLDVTETWRFGRGFIEEEMECNLDFADSKKFYAKPDEGEQEGCEFDDSIQVLFEFSDDVSIEDQEAFKQCYYRGDEEGRGGVGYIHEGDHNWEIEDEAIWIYPPVKVEFCEEDGTVIRDVKLRTWEEWKELYEKLGGRYLVPRDTYLKPEKIDNPFNPTKTEEEIADLVRSLGL